jgi:hypothetical protein
VAVNFSTLVYNPCQTVFGRPVNFTSKSGTSFNGPGRGIYNSTSLNVGLEDGSILSDQDTILDIRADEFPTLPVQGDTIDIPYEPIAMLPALGQYEITNVWHNGGGEITLQLRVIAAA